jgi:undecaprenyl-phosphate 4-deoxy-4-formamido-L-arabinose transferase
VTSLDIIIPVYNSSKYLGELLESILAQDCYKGLEVRIILVNDGSQDDTLEVCQSFSKKHAEIITLDLMRNFGQHAAIFAGLSVSNSDLILTMDDDGQHPPDSIPRMLASMDKDTDVVYGVAETEEHTHLRNFFSKSFKWLIFRLLGVKNARKVSAFRLIRSEVLKSNNSVNFNSVILDVVIHWNTTRIIAIDVPMNKRRYGDSNYNFLKLMKLSGNAISSYSTRPLRIASLLGLVSFASSTMIFLLIFIRYVLGDIQVPGFATIALLVTSIGSVQLVTLGIFGEYLGNIHQKAIGKPHYLIRKPRTP